MTSDGTPRSDRRWTVRRAVPADAPALSLVGAATVLETYASFLDGADLVTFCAEQHGADRYAYWAGRPGAAVFIALSETGSPVGYAVLVPPSPEIAMAGLRDDDVELKRIYVLSPFQGAGLGAALMAHSIEAAAALGAKRLLVGVLGRNAQALTFYAKHRFGSIGTRQFRAGETDYDDVVLAREL